MACAWMSAVKRIVRPERYSSLVYKHGTESGGESPLYGAASAGCSQGSGFGFRSREGFPLVARPISALRGNSPGSSPRSLHCLINEGKLWNGSSWESIGLHVMGSDGLSILECRPADEKAVHEFTLLANYVFGYTGDIVSISYGNRKASYPKDKDQRQAG